MQDAIVDKVAARVWALMNGQPIETGRRKVIVIFTGAVSGFAAGREAVARLVRSEHELTVMMTPSARHIFGEAPLRQAGVSAIVDPEPWHDVGEWTRTTDLVLVPTLTMAFATRLALGLMDGPAATLVLGALLAGKPVLAIRDGADPAAKRGEALGAVPSGAPALWALLEARLATLQSFGVELVGKGDFLFALERRLITPRAAAVKAAIAPVTTATIAAPAPALGPFITQGDVAGLAPGTRFRIGPGQRLTAAAAETAARLALVLEDA